MKTHTLAKMLLEGPDVLVVIQGHEPNEDTFDEITEVVDREAWHVDHVGKGYSDELYTDPPRNETLRTRSVAVVVLR